jgi:hypothetical protein
MCYCLKCFDNKNVVVSSSDAEIYSVVQGDMKTTNRLCHKKKKKKECFITNPLYGAVMSSSKPIFVQQQLGPN